MIRTRRDVLRGPGAVARVYGVVRRFLVRLGAGKEEDAYVRVDFNFPEIDGARWVSPKDFPGGVPPEGTRVTVGDGEGSHAAGLVLGQIVLIKVDMSTFTSEGFPDDATRG